MKMNKIILILVATIVLASCNESIVCKVHEKSTVITVTSAQYYGNKQYMYYVITEDYNFYTDQLYQVGDTIILQHK